MNKLLDSFWRALAYCVHPRVIALSILPLVIMAGMSLSLGYFFWEDAVSAVRTNLSSYSLVNAMGTWLGGMGLDSLRMVLAPALLLMLAIPAIAIISLLFVATFMTPAMVVLVADRRFPDLVRKRGGSFFASLFWSLGSALLAIVAMLVSMPLWLIPPLILVLPPLIWGWLTYRVMTYDSLAEHASREERHAITKRHRASLLLIGIISGFLGAIPSVLWASGAMFVVMAPILVPVAIWIYTLVFAFSSLWFGHFCLAALDDLRRQALALESDPLAQAVLASTSDSTAPGFPQSPTPTFGAPDDPFGAKP
jgi:hypothetical protein